MALNYIAANARRTTRNLLIANAALIGIIVAVTLLSSRYLYNFLSGPFVMDREELFALSDVRDLHEYYVTVNGDDAFDTGIDEVGSRTHYGFQTGEKVSAHFIALALDNRLLLVKMPSVNLSQQVTGALAPLPDDIQLEKLDEIVREETGLDGVFMPFMLDVNDFRTSGYIGFAVGVPLALLALRNLFKVMQRRVNPEAHPIYRGLSAYGPLQATIAAVDAEASNPANIRIGRTLITPCWVLSEATFQLDAMRLEDLVWAHKKAAQLRVNLIPTARTQSAILWDRNGRAIKITAKEAQITAILVNVAQRMPWVLVGYTRDLDKAWKTNRQAVLQAVADRRREARVQGISA